MKTHHYILSANFHAGSEVVNYPWDSKPALHPDNTWFRYISKEFADSAIYYGTGGYFKTIVDTETIKGVTNGWDWYPLYGGRQDCITYFYGGREVTIELDSTKLTPEDSLPNLWNYTRRSYLHYLEQAMFGIRGFVFDSLTNKPLKAKIELEGYDDSSSIVYSDSLTGKYYRLIYEGNYTLRCSANRYITKEIQNVEALNRKQTWLNIALKPGIGKDTFVQKSEIAKLKIGPNPCNQYIYFKGLENSFVTANCKIIDITGKTIINLNQANLNNGIDVRFLQPGIYFLKINLSNNILTKKIIIIR